jgi:hypothetical protein
MSDAPVWRDEPRGARLSRDPYGQWALTDGRGYLVDYRGTMGPGQGCEISFHRHRPDGAGLAAEDPRIVDDSGDMWVPALHLGGDHDDGDPGDHGHGRRGLPPLRLPTPLHRDSINPAGRFGAPSWTAPEGLADAPAPVVIGVIDDGIAFCNDRFRLPGGASRVDFAWMQEAAHAPRGKVPFGREYGRAEIETAVAAAQDEDALLVALGLGDLRRPQQPTSFRHASHGTATADLAAGYGPEEAALAEDRRIIAVSVPGLANWDGSGSALGCFVAWGVSYILRRARLMAEALWGERTTRSLPVIINLSYGMSGGPHDGTHALEKLVAGMLERWRVGAPAHAPRTAEIVIAAGNDFLTRRHASVVAGASGAAVLRAPWRVGPGDRTSSFLEVWLPAGAADLTLTVAPPTGPTTTWTPGLRDDARRLTLGSHGPAIARLSVDAPLWGGGRRRAVLTLAPTDTDALDTPAPAAPSGLWTVEVAATLAPGARIDAWLRREELPFGYRARGGPSYFDDPANARFTDAGDWAEDDVPASVVRRYGSLSGGATGAGALVIGAHRNGDRRAAHYSGASRPGMAARPCATTPADASRALPGALASGNRSGSRLSLSGTSAAAPMITRLLAEEIVEVQALGAAAVIADRAAAGEARIARERGWSPGPGHSAMGPPPPIDADQGGAGRIMAPGSAAHSVTRGRRTD